MERCSHCQNELTPGFDFCHHCGASIQTQTDPQASRMQQAVEVVDQLKGLQSQVLNTGSSAKQLMNQWLGSPISLQRQIFYSLWTALALVLSMGSNPFNGKPFSWLEGWLLLSIFLLPVIHYQITGLLPFASIGNALLGDLFSTRRRLILAFLWTLGPWMLLGFVLKGVFQPLADSMGPEALGMGTRPSTATGTAAGAPVSNFESFRVILTYSATLFGSFLINYYFMGFASCWRQRHEFGGKWLGSSLISEVDRAANLIKSRLEDCKIRDLSISSIAMSTLRRHTAGEASGTHGQQLVLTRGRARTVIFVQDFGQSLFVRWSCYYDSSGRRLWVLYGLWIDLFNKLFLKWTGTHPYEMWQSFAKVLNPFNGGRDTIMYDKAGLFSSLFRLETSISEYTVNDISALEGSVRECLQEVLGEVQAAHREAEEIEKSNLKHGLLEQDATSSFGAWGTSPAAGERHTP